MDRPLRALFVNEGAHGGKILGHPRVEASLRQSLTGRDDVEARFVQLGGAGRLARLAFRGVPVLGRLDLDLQPVRWHLTHSLRARALTRAALAEAPADVLHVTSHTVGLRLGRIMDEVPTFLNVDADIATWEGLGLWREVRPWTTTVLRPSLAAERRAFERAAGVIAWTEWTASRIRKGPDPERLHVLHPGIDLGAFVPAPKERRERPRLLFVGGRFAEKGGDVLLAALDELGGRIELDVVTRDEVEARPGLRAHHLEAGSPDLVRLFQQADALCLPSRGDAVPWVVLEAMACGTPVVASDVGAIGEMTGHGDAGVTVPVDDGRALRSVLEDLVADPEAWAARGRAGRARCEAVYDNRRQASALVELLASAVPG